MRQGLCNGFFIIGCNPVLSGSDNPSSSKKNFFHFCRLGIYTFSFHKSTCCRFPMHVFLKDRILAQHHVKEIEVTTETTIGTMLIRVTILGNSTLLNADVPDMKDDIL